MNHSFLFVVGSLFLFLFGVAVGYTNGYRNGNNDLVEKHSAYFWGKKVRK